MPEWFEEWFGEEYLQLYPHRDEAEADRAVALVARDDRAPAGMAGARRRAAGPGGTRARSARPARAASGSICRAPSCASPAGVTDAPLVRADMRGLPIRPGSMDLTVSLFTSFGYFEHDEEHAGALREMVGTLRPGGWFVIDFLNASEVRARLVARERVRGGRGRGGRGPVGLARWTLRLQDDRDPRRPQVLERVRLFEPAQIAAMLGDAGIEVRHRFGDYDAAPLRAGSPRTILAGSVA